MTLDYKITAAVDDFRFRHYGSLAALPDECITHIGQFVVTILDKTHLKENHPFYINLMKWLWIPSLQETDTRFSTWMHKRFNIFTTLSNSDLENILPRFEKFKIGGGSEQITIVPYLEKCRNLKKLVFNDISEDAQRCFNITKLTNLTELEVNVSTLTVDFHTNIRSLLSLTSLQLAFSYNEPEKVVQFTHLKTLKFWGDPIPNIADLTFLKELHILSAQENRFTDISKLSNLKSLLLKYDVWVPHENAPIDLCPLNLESLSLFNVPIELACVQMLTKLNVLKLENSIQLQDHDLESMSLLTNLTTLAFSEWKSLKLNWLRHFTQLSELDLSIDDLDDFSVLHHLTELKRLTLTKSQWFNDSGLKYLLPLTKLESLNLGDNQITIEGFSQLTSFHNLSKLSIAVYLHEHAKVSSLLRTLLPNLQSLKLPISITLPIR